GAAIVESLHPRWLSTDRVISLMSKARRGGPRRTSLLPYYLGQKVFRDTPQAERTRLLQATLDLVGVEGDPKTVTRPWLLDPLAHLAPEFAANPGSAGLQPLLPVLRLFAHLADRGRREPGMGHDEIRKLVVARADVRQLAFWDDVEDFEKRTEKRIRRYVDLL